MIVVDTNVVSELTRPRPDPVVVEWFDRQTPDGLYLASVTVAEMLFGVYVMSEGTKKARVELLTERTLALFPRRILPYTERGARTFARLAAAARRTGRPTALADGYIAATALDLGFAVATRNVRHFTGLGVDVINPWKI